MLTPQTLNKIPNELVDLVNELQIDVIKSISEKIVKADYLTPSAEWQLYKAQQLMMSTNDVNKLIASYTGKSKRQISKMYTDACKGAINIDAKIYRAAGQDAASFLRSVAFSEVLKAGIENTIGVMSNFTNSMVQSSRSTVTHLMDKAYMQVLSGAFSYQEAIYNAVSELAGKGIVSVKYQSGHTDWADVAVRRAVLTGVNQTTAKLQINLADDMGTDLVEITSHMGARPSHADWQGGIYSLSGKHRKYPSLSSATGYGTGDGLCGWNCRHNFYPFIEGVSEKVDFAIDKEENQREYELSQEQRAMERSIRKSKRSCAAYNEAIKNVDDSDVNLKRKLQNKFDKASFNLKNKESKLNDFLVANNLKLQNDRVRVVGFDKGVSNKVVAGNRHYIGKQLDKSIISGKINKSEYDKLLSERTVIDRSGSSPKSLSITGKANSISDLVDSGTVIQRRIYGFNGKSIVDFDINDHGKPKYHPTYSHKHIFDYTQKNPHGKARKINANELYNNKDIITKGVNYFDK